MADNKLEIEIGVEVKSLKDGVNKAKASMKSLERQQDDLNNAFKKGDITEEKLIQETKRLNAEYKKLDTQVKKDAVSIKNLTRAQKEVGANMNKVGKATKANATPAIMEFGRVIQDAPYGIQGVANNLNQLVDQFGYLKKNTGSTSEALKSMVGGLMGPAGFGVALAVVTGLMIKFGDEIGFVDKKTKDLVKSTKDLSASASVEMSDIESLIRVAQDQTLSYDQRNVALEKAKGASDGYLDSLTLETLATKDATSKLDELTMAMQRNAKVKGLQDLLTKAYAKQFEIMNEGVKGQLTSFKSLTAMIQGKGLSGAYIALADDLIDVNEEIQALTQVIEPLQDEQNKQNAITEDATNKINAQVKALKDLSKEREKQLSQAMDITSNASVGVNLDTNTLPTLDIPAQLKFMLTGNTWDSLNNAMGEVKTKTEVLAKQMGSIVNSQFANALSGIGQVIGDAFVNGGNVLQGLGKVLLGSLGSLLTQVGQMALAVGIGLQSIQASLLTLNPAAAIGAGIALIALGSAFSSTAKSLGGGMSGGSTTTSDVGGTGSSGSRYSSSNYSSGGMGSGKAVFEIQGTKLVGVLNNTLKRNKSLGGTNNLLFT